MNAAIELDYFGGYAPIQAWGKVSNLNFYFRARWDTWTFKIGKPGVEVPTTENDALLFAREGEFLPNDFHEEMVGVIVNCFQEYFTETRNPRSTDLLSDLNKKLKAAINLKSS